MIVTLSNPKDLIVKLEHKGTCKDPRCKDKKLYWALVKTTGKKMLVSLLPDGKYIQHFKDCPSNNIFSSSNKKFDEKKKEPNKEKPKQDTLRL